MTGESSAYSDIQVQLMSPLGADPERTMTASARAPETHAIVSTPDGKLRLRTRRRVRRGNSSSVAVDTPQPTRSSLRHAAPPVPEASPAVQRIVLELRPEGGLATVAANDVVIDVPTSPQPPVASPEPASPTKVWNRGDPPLRLGATSGGGDDFESSEFAEPDSSPMAVTMVDPALFFDSSSAKESG